MTEGEILAGKYRVEGVLGAGGMGMVVAAHHIGLNERVAIKFLLPGMLGNAEAVSLFAREARAAVKIKSENVARILDVGTLETGVPYMVMEYLEGSDLSTWIERGALPIEQAVDFIIQACVAIAEAHGLGIIHRDLKPSNLFCVRGADGRLTIKVLDFGISKVTGIAGVGSTSSTRSGAMMGSPRYMSPEHMQSAKAVDARTDIWALGVVLYELLTGRPPFRSENLAEIIVQIATHAPEPLRLFRPDVPEGLEGVVLRCTEKDRDRRYQNVAEFALALLPFAPRSSKAAVEKIVGIVQSSGLSATALSVPPSPGAAPRVPTATEAGLGGTAGPAVVGRGRAIAALAGAVTLTVVVSASWRMSRPPEDAAAGKASTTIASSAAAAIAASAWRTVQEPERLAGPATPSTPTPTPTPTPTLPPTMRPHAPASASARALAPAPLPAHAPPADPLQALKPH